VYPLENGLRLKVSRGSWFVPEVPMRLTLKFLPCVVILLAGFSAIPQLANAKEKAQPQMVWVNYAEGNVKFSPGHKGEPRLGTDWIVANRGQVMEDGYTLVTEKGRAEVEFEDGSIVYLAENSALEFDWLWIRGQATETELSLLAGKLTVDHATKNPITLYTPSMWMSFEKTGAIRVDCALNGVVIKPISGTIEDRTPHGIVTMPPGQSALYYGGKLIPLGTPEPLADDEPWIGQLDMTVSQNRMAPVEPNDEWDTWVAARMDKRRQLVAEGMKESGLTEPIPGLAGMVESGRFFDCVPQGKCWQPNAPAAEGGTQLATNLTAQGSPEMSVPSGVGIASSIPSSDTESVVVNRTMMTRCPLEAWRMTASQQGNDAGATPQYGTCLAGTWNASSWNQNDPQDPCWRRDPMTQRLTYWSGCDVYPTWVVGGRHRHECHFLKTGKHQIGIVPRHSLDQKGRPPVNLKSGILVLTAEKGKLQAGVERSPGKGITVVNNPPRGMERGLVENAPRVGQPVIEAKVASAILPKGTVGVIPTKAEKNVSVARLDFRSGNFVGRTGASAGGHGVVMGHVGGGGGGGHTGGGSFGGGSHGGFGGGGHSGGGAGGGGGHSGGGASGGGGGGGGGHH
jgi:hypothetical protein